MLDFEMIRDNNGDIDRIETHLTGHALLESPKLNKGCAFSLHEREEFGILGKLPTKVESLQEQVERHYIQYSQYETNLQKNIYLNAIHDTNETLYFSLVGSHLEEMMPIIYTPTEGEAIANFSSEMRKPRGIFITYNDRDRIPELLKQRLSNQVDIIVATDAEQILGIGDQGAGGIAISVAKLAVYTLCARLNPHHVLPIMLDVGTDNEDLLKDPNYLGWRHKRIRGDQYYEFIDKFVTAVKNEFPWVYLHWEDFGRDNARTILEIYQDKLCTFNDDMQGTGAITLSSALSAVKRSGQRLADQRIVVFGAGTAGVGIADQLRAAMKRDGNEQAEAQIWLIDKEGLLCEGDHDLVDFQQPYAKNRAELSSWAGGASGKIDLLAVVKNVKPTMLVGCSTCHGAFTEAVIREMAAHTDNPIILPLSNPTSKCEAEPKDIIPWTDGRAIIATGSPFAPVEYKGVTYHTAECNNAFIYPGIGLGVLAVKPSMLSDEMIWAACKTLSDFAPTTNKQGGSLLPGFDQLHAVSDAIAKAVAEEAVKSGLAECDDIDYAIRATKWDAKYYPYNLAK